MKADEVKAEFQRLEEERTFPGMQTRDYCRTCIDIMVEIMAKAIEAKTEADEGPIDESENEMALGMAKLRGKQP